LGNKLPQTGIPVLCGVIKNNLGINKQLYLSDEGDLSKIKFFTIT